MISRWDRRVGLRGWSGCIFVVALIGWVSMAFGESNPAIEVERQSAEVPSIAESAIPVPVVAAAPREAQVEEDESTFAIFNSDDPIEIQSQELEVTAEGDAKRIIFRSDVQVVQGDVTMFADYLEALYPAGASNPDRLDARGRVRVVDETREIQCNEATYYREDEIVTCRGDAVLILGCDEVHGGEIEFNLSDERVKVIGGAEMILRPSSGDASDDCPAGGAG